MQPSIELARVEGNKVKSIRSLREDEIQEIRDCNKEIFDFNRHFKLIEYVLYNFSCLKSVIENSVQGFSDEPDTIGRYDLDTFSHEVNINLLNLMTSTRTFLDHMNTFVKREYGKESPETKLFKTLKADEFDSKFSYKFMYKLRNYVQHCGMPPLSYSKKKVLDGEAPYASINLEFERDALLSGFDDWGKIVKPELEAQESKFSALGIVEEFVTSILRIYISFNDQTKFPKTLRSRARIAQIISQSETYFEDDYCLFTASKNGGDAVAFKMSWIPASLFQKVEHYLNLKGKI